MNLGLGKTRTEVVGETLPAMNQNPFPRDDARNSNQKLPPVGKGVRVRHLGLERIAYLDGQGKWRNYDTGEVLREELTILSFDLKP